MDPPSMKNLLDYLDYSFTENNACMGLHLPWNQNTTMFLLQYVFKFISCSEHSEFYDTIVALDELAECLHDAIVAVEYGDESYTQETFTKHEQFSEMFVSSFFPEVVRRFFTVPKLNQLPQSHLCQNENIAGFMDFLLQVLYHETNISSDDQVQHWTLVRKELSFLLAVLGDIPFQCTHHHEFVEQINILLVEFELLANEAGSFVYDGVFSIHQMESNKFHEITTAWFEKVDHLNVKIKEHNIKFSELPVSSISRSRVVDSFFIIHSLIEDIESLKNHRLSFIHGDAIMEQIETLFGMLTMAQSFIKVLGDDEKSEGLIQIRDLTYEAEYLINSLVVGNIHAWYLNLRLPSIIYKIKLACIACQQIMVDARASDGHVSFPPMGDTATMDDNHFLDFNDDITQRILKDQSEYMKILEHGYQHLPRNIKPCFLYFAAFPKDYGIPQEKLTWLWISEGFILREGNKSLEETAETYLLDLIKRKLVLISKRGSDGAMKMCRIHSLLHEFCTRKANEEYFSNFTNCGLFLYERCQRFCASSDQPWSPFGHHCRSSRGFSTEASYFQTMALLKVVDESPEYDTYNSALSFPSQLRYLGVNRLSSKMVANLVNLEFIYISRKEKVFVPSVVLRMVKLRHVVTKGEAEFEEDCCSNMTETTNLRTLSIVCINGEKDEEILRRTPHLHKLKCIFGDRTKFPDISFLAELESLKMSFRDGLIGISSSKINFPSTIKKLSLCNSMLPCEMISILGRLPNLGVLKLKSYAFVGDVWETRDGEFQNLKCFSVCQCPVRLWISCSEHFPVLERLVIRSCWNLREIPSDFCNIPTLQRIQVKECKREVCFSALQVGKKIQVDIARSITYNFTPENINMARADLNNVLSCIEEYFKGGAREDESTTGAFVSRDGLTTKNDVGDEPLIFVNQRTYFVVVSYAMQARSNLENLTIMDLCCIAGSYIIRRETFSENPRYVDEIKKSRREFSDKLVNSFIPEVQKFFEVPSIEQFPDIKKNEILAGFMDFLLQMMFCEDDSPVADQYALLHKDFSFLLAVLGDIPFQPSTYPEFDDQVNNLLAEFKMFANEAGHFLFSCVFPIQPMKANKFHAETNALLEMAKLLNAKIKEHCSIFSELPASAIVRSTVVDSFFIIGSLIEDLQNIMTNGQIRNSTPDDAINDYMRTLLGELTLSQSFIKVISDNDNSKMNGGLIQIRDLAYEAEYLINSLVVGNIHAWYLNLRLPSIIHKIKLACIGCQQISDTKASDGHVSFPTMGNTATVNENQFLDFDHDITQRIFMDLTMKLDTSRLIISIFGMPGLGKTATANNLYSCCSGYFDRHAWCTVSQSYSMRNLMIQILLCVLIKPDEDEIVKKDVVGLSVDIHQTLKGRRYLIVLDDVWHSDVLDKLKIYFPDDGNGSRIIVTTRNKYVSPSGGSKIYKLPFLSEYQCWNLLERKVFHEDPCPSDLVSIGKRIAARCSGVPLAVVSIAGVLANLKREESEWRSVEEGLDKILLDDQSCNSYRKIMELSYQHLPHNIKPCFLYFARYPEDAEISTKELTWFWIAQGFIQKDGNKSPEEIAEMYLSDLISRSLVMTSKRRSAGGIKTCKIHDLLHDICIKKADEENFLKSTSLFYTYEKHQHLCLPSSSNITWRPLGLRCRSFRGHTEQSSGFRTMALMKVIDLLQEHKLSFYGLPGVDLPCQLRYLDISIDELRTGMLENLVNLETICVRGSGITIPSVILRMAKLRHLLVRHSARFEEDCSNISEATNLRYISSVVISEKSDVEILRKSPHLQTLRCVCRSRNRKMFPDFSSLAELQSLRINFENRFFGDEVMFPANIKKLCLSHCRLGSIKMSIIGKLPYLQVLKLEEGCFVIKEWETKDDQFAELRILKIEAPNLENWSSETCHFPSLEQLVLHKCLRLVEIPSDLGYIPSLQRIELDQCSRKACLSGIEMEKEQGEFGNQELQVEISHYDWTKEQLMQEVRQRERY